MSTMHPGTISSLRHWPSTYIYPHIQDIKKKNLLPFLHGSVQILTSPLQALSEVHRSQHEHSEWSEAMQRSDGSLAALYIYHIP